MTKITFDLKEFKSFIESFDHNDGIYRVNDDGNVSAWSYCVEHVLIKGKITSGSPKMNWV